VAIVVSRHRYLWRSGWRRLSKTFALLLETLRHSNNPGFGSVIFRRTNEDIRNEGALWDSSKEMFSAVGAKPREVNLDWTFQSGATVSFKGLQHEKDVLNFQGSQICLLGFDELTHFTERQFWYMLSRNRSMCGVRPYCRCTLNPDPDSWVFELLAPWVDPESPHYGAKSGELRYFVRRDDQLIWVDEATDDCKSITFIPALLSDNKILMERDPGYLANLKAQSHEDQQRLLYGSWSAIEAKGALWSRSNLNRDRVQFGQTPKYERTVVAIDPATTSNDDSDLTGIVVAAKGVDGHFYTLADHSGQYQPADWARVAISLFKRFDCSCIVAESNQGGEMVKNTIQTIEHLPVKLVHAKQGKELRAEPVAALSSQGKDHHVGNFPALEGELTRWIPGSKMASPNRMDAKVYAILELDPSIERNKNPLKPRPRQYA